MGFDGIVMPALVAGIHVLNPRQDKDVDGRNKSGHDGVWFCLNISRSKTRALCLRLNDPSPISPRNTRAVTEPSPRAKSERIESIGIPIGLEF